MTPSPSVWTLFVGPFVGAFLAFALARMYDADRRFKEQLAAANLALLLLKNQYNDFVVFRRGFRNDCARKGLNGNEPEWMLVRPSLLGYAESDFKYESIVFLLESSPRKAVFDAIEETQIAHRDLVKLDAHRTETARTTQRQIADAEKKRPLVEH